MRTLRLVAAVVVGPALVVAGVLVAPARVADELLAADLSLDVAAPVTTAPAPPTESHPQPAATLAVPVVATEPAPAPPPVVEVTAAPPRVAEPGQDLTGATLSAVSLAGTDGPPVPEDSGTGRRLVFSRDQQRVWAVDDDDVAVRTWLVAGSKYGNDPAGTYTVFTRARWIESYTGGSQLQWFVGFYRTPRDNVIGFHEIPRTTRGLIHGTGLLGTRQSSGCIRQATEDAAFLFDWAPEGTPVIVV